MENKLRDLNAHNKKLLLILLAVGCIVYAVNMGTPLFWDDDEWIIGNTFVHDFAHIPEIFSHNVLGGFGLNSNYYRPLLLLSFAFNYVVHGESPGGYHLISNGLHIGAGLLIFLILMRFIGSRITAFIAALLFIIHPLQTEAVTYISGRGDPMSVFFMLGALWLWIKSHDWYPSSRSWWAYAASFLSFIIAILSRETAILFPVLLFLAIYCFSREKNIIAALRAVVPYAIISVIYFILRLTVLNFENTLNFYSQSNTYTEHLSYRLYTFGHALYEYAKLIFVPVGLHMERELPVQTSLLDWPVWIAALGLCALVACTGWLMYRHRRVGGKILWIWLFSWGWFFIALAPVSGIVPINAFMYEHWLYLPFIGLFTLIGYSLTQLFEYLSQRQNLKTIKLALLTVWVAYAGILCIATMKRNIAWGNTAAFYEDILRYNPTSVRILNNLGNLYADNQEFEKAISAYEKAANANTAEKFAQPYYNIANIYRDQGQTERAVEYYQKAIEIDPLFPFAYQNLAVIAANHGDYRAATEYLEYVRHLRPSDPLAYYYLGVLYIELKEYDRAIEALESGQKYTGTNTELLNTMKELREKALLAKNV